MGEARSKAAGARNEKAAGRIMDAGKKPRIIQGIVDLGLTIAPTTTNALCQTLVDQATDAFLEMYRLKNLCAVLGVLTIDETRLEPDIALEVIDDNLESAHDLKNRVNKMKRLLDDIQLNINHFEQYSSKRRKYVKGRQA